MTGRRTRTWTTSRILLACSIVSFCLSLWLDAFYIDRPSDPRAWSTGLGLLVIGWIGVLSGVPAWLANPFLLLGWLALYLKAGTSLTVIPCFIALAFALSFLLCSDLLTSEAGTREAITGYGAGYWAWTGSTLFALLASIFQTFDQAAVT